MKMGECTQSKYAPLRDDIKKKIDSVCFERNRRQKNTRIFRENDTK